MPARKAKPMRIEKEPVDQVVIMAEDPSTSLSVNGDAVGTTGKRRSTRKRPAAKILSADDELADGDFQIILKAFPPNAEKLETVPEEPEKVKTPRKRPRKSRKKAAKTASQPEADIEVDEQNLRTGPFEISNRRAAAAKKQVVVAETNSGEKQSEDEEEETIRIEDVQKYIKHIKTPRSSENSKYKNVYDTIPKLRNASPPRFTTKGVPKKRLDPEELGVRIVGKTVGNPFSGYGNKRNGIIYGNQPLKTVEEMEKYAGAAISVKKVLRKQSEHLRLSSYVKPKVLEEARKKHVLKKPTKIKEEDIDIDIETVDDSLVDLMPHAEGKCKRNPGGGRGRKPGRTILECVICGYKTTHSGHMKIHILCVHKDVKLMECQYEGCGYRCARKGSMTRHEKCVHRKDEVFKCELCKFESAWSISLERHIITKHEKLRPWTCEICERSFGQQFTLTTHMNTVHKKVKRIRCAFCNFRSATKVSVRAHILRMHKEEIEKAMNEAEVNEEGAHDNEMKQIEAAA